MSKVRVLELLVLTSEHSVIAYHVSFSDVQDRGSNPIEVKSLKTLEILLTSA